MMDCGARLSAGPSTENTFDFLHCSTGSGSVDSDAQPELDNKPLTRQKRRRTSPQDQAILEAAYKRDPKPDKIARLELVRQVSLNEKEVQIWLQNRRQSSRRKSRPLLPHEVAQYQLSRATTAPDPSKLNQEAECDLEYVNRVSNNDAGGSPAYSDDSEAAESGDSFHAAENPLHFPVDPTSSERDEAPVATKARSASRYQELPSSSALSTVVSASAYEPSSAVGYLANRRSEPFLHRSFSDNYVPPPAPVVKRERHLKKSSSLVRLSMDSQGKAVVTTKDVSSPSPPRPQQFVLPDAIPAMNDTPSLPAVSDLKKSLSGRSRDSRSWEFWCDKESRIELENAAVSDAKGSAAGAIGLLRTSSGRSVLGTLSAKRNAMFSSRPDRAKRSKHEHRRSFLRPSRSSDRLQNTRESTEDVPPQLKPSSPARSIVIKGNDSDKENWSPSQDSAANTHGVERSRHMRAHQSEEATDPEADPELSAFMGGGRNSGKGSPDDDFDCVQGLLSLSQGNWR